MTKPDNRLTFYGEDYGYVQLVKRSIAYRWHTGHWYNSLKMEWEVGAFYYWRGQLVQDWYAENKKTGEKWQFSKGRIIWLRADIFKQILTVS